MPATTIFFYCDDSERTPVLEWLQKLREENQKAYAKCVARIRRLAAEGHELRRPEADFLRDGIYELRARSGNVNYRLLYFFHGQNVAVLAHGLTKEADVPTADIERTLERKKRFEKGPDKHTHEEETEDG